MVTPNYPPHRGGVESHTYEVARRLAATDEFAISVLTTDRTNQLPRRERAAGVDIERVGAWPRGGDLYWSAEVYRRVLAADVDLIHCQGYHTFVPVLAMLAARRAHRPMVLTFHSGGHSSRLRHAIRPVQLRLLRPLIAAACRLIAVSEFEAALFRRYLRIAPERIVVIPNGVDLPHASGDTTPERDPGLIVSVGRLERYKGHERLVRALPLVRTDVPEARLLILGEGPEVERLQAAARQAGVAESVSITSIPRVEMWDTLRRAAVVALLSEYESQGLGAYEALELGGRVVVNDAGALAELARHDQVVAVPRDSDDRTVADALVGQLRAGPVLDEDRPILPSWDECARSLADVYRTAIGRDGV